MTETVRGFRDYTGEEAEKREAVRRKIEEIFKLYGFEPAETPVIEFEEFVREDNEYDEAVSDIFKLRDKGERSLALRYEFTFQLKRIAKNKKLPYKRYQIGYVFRDEPVASNRFRQFTQCDVDVIGSDIREEAEILSLLSSILKELKVDAEIQVNSRKMMNSAIKSIGIENTEYALRQIDKIDKQGEDAVKLEMTKFIDKERIIKLFKLFEKPLSFFRKYEGYRELKGLIDMASEYGIKLVFKPSLARGLSYYNGSVFEARAKETKESVCGGGSYLINGIQSTGWSFGLERLSQLAKLKAENKKILIISINQDKKARLLAKKLRSRGNPCIIYYGKPSKALEYANSCSISKAIFIGKDEIKARKLKVKDLKTGKESMMSEKELLKC